MKRIENYDVKIFADHIDELAEEQIRQLLSIDVFGKCKIRIMPDVHVGAGCVIGFTGDLGDKVIPNIVGVDIGCGILVQPFCCLKEIDYHRLNEYILRMCRRGEITVTTSMLRFRSNTWMCIAKPKTLSGNCVVTAS